MAVTYQLGLRSQQQAQRNGRRQNPLAKGHVQKDLVEQMHGRLRGPPAAQAARGHHRDGPWHGIPAGDAALKHGAGRHWTRSLRFWLLAATLAALAVALVLAGLLLSSLFRDHVMRQFSQSLTAQLGS